MLAARAMVGLGEAGYGSAGGAILMHVFPKERHAMIVGAFLAAALFGSVGGVIFGGIVSTHFSWRAAFIGVGAARAPAGGAVPAGRARLQDGRAGEEGRVGRIRDGHRMRVGEIVRELFVPRTAIFTYLASGSQMFTLGVINAWIPSYMSRYYGLAPDKAAMQAGDRRAGRGRRHDRLRLDRRSPRPARPAEQAARAGLYAMLTCVLLVLAFASAARAGAVRVDIWPACSSAGGHTGAAGAVITDVTHPGLRATAFAMIVLGNNLLGLAPGPVVVGALSDVYGLKFAMGVAPLMCLAAATFFLLASRHYARESGRFDGAGGHRACAAPDGADEER